MFWQSPFTAFQNDASLAGQTLRNEKKKTTHPLTCMFALLSKKQNQKAAKWTLTAHAKFQSISSEALTEHSSGILTDKRLLHCSLKIIWALKKKKILSKQLYNLDEDNNKMCNKINSLS